MTEEKKKEITEDGEKKVVIQPMVTGFLDDRKEIIRFVIPMVVAITTLIICMAKV